MKMQMGYFFFFQAEDGIRDRNVTGVQTCALPIYIHRRGPRRARVRGGVPSYPMLRKLEAVLVCPLIARELLREALFVPHLEVIDLAEHAHIADDRRALAQQRRDDDAPLAIELALLAVV